MQFISHTAYACVCVTARLLLVFVLLAFFSLIVVRNLSHYGRAMPGECFEIKLDVQRCKREDIVVEWLDNCLVIHTRKCKPGDNSIVARKFSKRTYPVELSKFDKETMHYEFDDKGMLNVQIHPKKADTTTA